MACVARHEHQDDNNKCYEPYSVAHARMHGTDCQDSVMKTAHQAQTRMMVTFSGAYSNRAKAIAKTQSRRSRTHITHRWRRSVLEKKRRTRRTKENIGSFNCEGSGGAAHPAGADTFLCRVHTVRHVKPFGVHKHKEKASRR